MWELDYKESWVPKNWCFWTVVLEKTLKSPLDSKEIQPVHPKGNQSWIFIGRTDAEAETPILWLPDAKSEWQPCMWDSKRPSFHFWGNCLFLSFCVQSTLSVFFLSLLRPSPMLVFCVFGVVHNILSLVVPSSVSVGCVEWSAFEE